MVRFQFRDRSSARIVWLTVLAFLSGTQIAGSAPPKLFPTDLPSAKWVEFQSDGFSRPVTGVIYRSEKPPCCGMPLGGLSTGCIDIDAAGVFGFSTIFSDYTLTQGYANPRGYPRQPGSFAPFLGLAVGDDAWVLSTRKIVDGGLVKGCGIGPDQSKVWDVTVPAIDGVGVADQIHYFGHYPVVDIEYETSAPVSVGLRAWSPFLPGDAKGSSVPGAVFEVRLRNESDEEQQGTIAFTFAGPAEHEDRNATEFLRQAIRGKNFHGVRVMANSDFQVEYSLGVVGSDEGIRLGGGLGRDGQAWANIRHELPTAVRLDPEMPGRARLEQRETIKPDAIEVISSTSRGVTAAVDFRLGPGEQRVVRFVLAWYAPSWIGSDDLRYSHYYSTFPEFRGMIGGDSSKVAEYLARDHATLLSRILAWQEVIYASTDLPGWLRDSLINTFHNIAEDSYWLSPDTPIIRDIYGKDGYFFGMLESPRECPQMSCIPCDWYGSHPIVYFYPELFRANLVAFKHFQSKSPSDHSEYAGEIPFGLNGWQVGRPYMSVPSFFWQMTLNSTCYADLVDRLWLRSGDDGVLKEFYDSVKQGTIFTMNLRPGPEGVISMPKGNKGMEWFEVGEFSGMCSHLGGMHLSQLRIAERMAKKMGDQEFVAQCQKWFEQGSTLMEEKMWVDGYYLNFWEPETGARSDDVISCQLDGQWAAKNHGLPDVYRADRVKEALATIKRCNVANTFCGAINFARPNGNPLAPDDPVAAYGTHSMFAAEVLVQSMTYMYEGEQEFGIELARRSLENLVCRQRHTWDNPCIVKGKSGERLSGHEYYQNMLIWALPACMSGQDLAGPCQPGGLVDRVMRAAAK